MYVSTTVAFMPLFAYKNATTKFAGLATNTYEATNRSTTYSGFAEDIFSHVEFFFYLTYY